MGSNKGQTTFELSPGTTAIVFAKTESPPDVVFDFGNILSASEKRFGKGGNGDGEKAAAAKEK